MQKRRDDFIFAAAVLNDDGSNAEQVADIGLAFPLAALVQMQLRRVTTRFHETVCEDRFFDDGLSARQLFTYPKFYLLVPVISSVRSARRNRSGGFWLASDLALDLFSEFQGPGNLRKNFGRPPGAPHDHCSVTQEPSERGFLDRDAFDPCQEQLDGAATGYPRFYDDSFVGNGHLPGAEPHTADACR